MADVVQGRQFVLLERLGFQFLFQVRQHVLEWWDVRCQLNRRRIACHAMPIDDAGDVDQSLA